MTAKKAPDATPLKEHLEKKVWVLAKRAWEFERATVFHHAPLGSDVPRSHVGLNQNRPLPETLHEVYAAMISYNIEQYLLEFIIAYNTYELLHGE